MDRNKFPSEGGTPSANDPKAARRALLANHFLLRGSDPALIDRILKFSTVRKVESNTNLFAKGDEADGLYGVLKGRLRVFVVSADGRELVLNFAEAGDLCGEIALLDGEPRSANVSTLDYCELLHVPRNHFMAFLQREPDLMARMIEILCSRLRRSSDLYEDSNFLDLPGKLAKRLLDLADTTGEPTPRGERVGVKLPQRLLAELTGTTREAVNKALKALRDGGLIDLEDGYYIVMDRAALEDMLH